MKIIHKKLMRELFGMKWKALVVILSFALAISLYGGLLLMQDSIFASRDAQLEKLDYEDFRISFLGDTPMAQVENFSADLDSIRAFDFRLAEDIVIKVSGENYFSRVTGISLNGNQPIVNKFHFFDGKAFRPNSNEIIITKSFAEPNNLKLGDTIDFNFNKTTYQFKIVGIVFSPEYKYNVNPVTGIPEPGSFAPIWISLDTLQSIFSKEGFINEIAVKVKEGSDIQHIKSTLSSYFKQRGIPATIIEGKEEADYRTMQTDIEALEETAIAIGVVVLFVAATVIYDTVTKIIHSQKQMIGLFMSLGADKKSIVFHYIQMSLLMTFGGIILSLPLGYVITYAFVEEYNSVIGLPEIVVKFNLQPFLEPIGLAVVISLLAAIVGTWSILRLKPVEALEDRSIPFPVKRKYSIENSIFKVAKVGYILRIPLRHVLYRRRRTILTALTISVASLLALSSLGFMDSMFKQIDDYYLGNVKYDYEITLSGPLPISHVKNVLKDYNPSFKVEEGIKSETLVTFDGNNETAILEAYVPNTQMRSISIGEGKFIDGQIVIGKVLATRLNAKIGDSLNLTLLNFQKFSAETRTFRISGISEELLDISVFMSYQQAEEMMGLEGRSMTFYLKAPGVDPEKLTKDLLDLPIGVQSVLSKEKSRNSILTLMQALLGFIGAIVVIGFLVLALFSINVVVVDTIEREREFVNIRANGGSTFHIFKIVATQIYLIAILTIGLNFIIVPPVTDSLVTETASDFMTIKTFIAPLTYIIGTIVTFLGLLVGVWLAVRYIRKLILAIAIRLRFES